MTDKLQRRLFQGFVCLLILKMAETHELQVSLILDELEQLGYRLSPGTLYPILRQLQEENQLVSYELPKNGKSRRFFRLTMHGKKALVEAMDYLQFLTEYMSQEAIRIKDVDEELLYKNS